MTRKVNVLDHSKILVQLALEESHASDNEYGSDDSYVPADDVVSCFNPESDSEMDADDVQHVKNLRNKKMNIRVVTEYSESDNNCNTDIELCNGQVYYGKNKCITCNIEESANHKVRQSNVIKVK
ncbi:hypothetical protein PR048_017341 [Dryococelus australis]|uniref:Uncharacterized protein n=1 Tax=Dryococelus australis TaxID=614101 RepID=A0ABQ9H998_9NEOP|nr:hypothetical protein PR048_017341 [Dryococelus australis]